MSNVATLFVVKLKTAEVKPPFNMYSIVLYLLKQTLYNLLSPKVKLGYHMPSRMDGNKVNSMLLYLAVNV